MNEFVSSLQTKRMDDFRNRFRNECDALLIGRRAVLQRQGPDPGGVLPHLQPRFDQRGVPIVITSDVQPQQLHGLAERLISRFASGLVAEIYPPEMETRLAILRKKAEHEKRPHRGRGPATAIASVAHSNVRELEGLLMKLAIKASLAGRDIIDGTLVRETLKLGTRPSVTTVEDVQRAVAEHYRIRVGQLSGRERHREVALPPTGRDVRVAHVPRNVLSQIGAKFSKDHTTVISAVRQGRAPCQGESRAPTIPGRYPASPRPFIRYFHPNEPSREGMPEQLSRLFRAAVHAMWTNQRSTDVSKAVCREHPVPCPIGTHPITSVDPLRKGNRSEAFCPFPQTPHLLQPPLEDFENSEAERRSR